MSVNTNPEKFQQALYQKKAEIRSITNVLNCYCREYATPKQQVIINPTFGRQDWPEAFNISLNKGSDQFLLLLLPESQSRLIVRVKDLKRLGQCRYTSAPYLKTLGNGWIKLSHNSLVQKLLKHLAIALKQPFNDELYQQIQNSLKNSQKFLLHRLSENKAKDAQQQLQNDGFIHSEQALLWGHAWHPSPKSREGIEWQELSALSPEVGANFQLTYLAVKEHLLEAINCEHFNGIRELQKLLKVNVPAGYVLMPCHPYQFARFKNNTLFVEAINQGVIIDLGNQGGNWYPTSSVRTLYNQGFNYFIKFSLHVRLTNCIRKNAWYELESAIFLTKVIDKFKAKHEDPFPAFNLMREPGSVTLNLATLFSKQKSSFSAKDNQEIGEAFGLLFRSSFNEKILNEQQPRVSAAIFADDENFSSAITPYVNALASTKQLSFNDTALLWFHHYITALLTPVLYYFFKLGLIFEPHLQNTVIGFHQHLPSNIHLRDLEGTKLIDTLWSQHELTSLSERAKQSIHYSRSQGWRRIAYCLFINNTSEAIFHLSASSKSQENKMWQLVRENLIEYQFNFGEEPELQDLLAGASIPCKCNFMTRLLKHADKEADYVQLSNPMGES
jgi:siderophore synthetase component